MRESLFDMSDHGKRCVRFSRGDVPDVDLEEALGAGEARTQALNLPEVTEPEIARHFARLARDNYNVDFGFYPLGSCTMKYNPKAMLAMARWPEWSLLHPDTPAECIQGALRLMWELEQWLAEIGGMDAASLQPPAGAAGEFTCLRMFRAYHDSRGDDRRRRVIVPDTAHGTNPASAARCGYAVTTIESAADGRVDLNALRNALSPDVAAVMLTNPNTLGLFETEIVHIAEMVHEAGALFYNDGANMNAVLTYVRPGDTGFDAMHFNLHKTFGTPHGGGGPGSGPVAVKSFLSDFLPVPGIVERDGQLEWDWDRPQSIGKVQGYYGNFLMAVQAYVYILSLGSEGLREVSETAVLNANYVMQALADTYELPYPGPYMHECVFSAKSLARQTGVRTIDIGKRLLDYGLHPPTVYFPAVVKEALMTEPTETESKETLDRFIEVMKKIAREARLSPELVTGAPHNTSVGRLDEVKAARELKLRR